MVCVIVVQSHAGPCTQVRAAALSGDCDLEQELWRGKVELTRPSSWFEVHARCVARRATLSVQLNPNCQGEVRKVVDLDAKLMLSGKLLQQQQSFGWRLFNKGTACSLMMGGYATFICMRTVSSISLSIPSHDTCLMLIDRSVDFCCKSLLPSS